MTPHKKNGSRWPIAASLLAHSLIIGLVLTFAAFGTHVAFPNTNTIMVSIVPAIKGDPVESRGTQKVASSLQTVLAPNRTKSKQPGKNNIEESPIQVDLTGQPAPPETTEAVQSVSALSNVDDSGPAEPEESVGAPPASSGTESAATASQDEIAGFLSQVRQIIERHKQYPWRARFQGLEGTTQLRFRILPTGEPEEIQVVESSKSAMLDEEAVAAVKRVARFPEPPVKSPLGIWIRLPFVFHLEKGG
jgi:TonB family protein